MDARFPSRDELSQVFEYINSELWRKAYVSQNGRKYPRKKVVNKINTHYGYCQVKFKNRMVKYHAIIWTFTKGDIPNGYIFDHIDGNRINNNLSNLRLVTKRQNNQNKPCHREGKLVGGYLDKRSQKWIAQVKVDGKSRHLGYYSTEFEAHKAYVNFLNKELNHE